MKNAWLLVLLAVSCDSGRPRPHRDRHDKRDDASDDNRLQCLLSPGGSQPVDRVISGLQDTARRNPTKVDAWALLGRAWVRKAREQADPTLYHNAARCADVVLALRPGSPLGESLHALVFMNQHRFRDARDAARRILQHDSDDLIALAVLSDAELELGNFDGAADATQKMVDLKPSLPSYSRAAHLRWLKGDSAAAKDMVRLAIRAGGDPRDPEPTAWTLVQAAGYFLQEGDYEGADAGYDRALATFADFPPALLGKARVALARGEPARAVELAEKSHRLSPLVEAAWVLGDARAAAGDAAGARASYDQVVRDGRRGDRLTLAAFLATKDRDHEEALRLVEEEARTRGGPNVEDVRAWALHRLGRDQEAKAAAERALSLGTREPRLLYHAGAIRLALGDAGGRALVEEALRVSPRFDPTGAPEAQALLHPTPAGPPR